MSTSYYADFSGFLPVFPVANFTLQFLLLHGQDLDKNVNEFLFQSGQQQ